ncbi:zinc ABC transporter substrate-binding protein [Vibrio sp. SCSIO 43136]|uniref:metal ABC transporter solute-binding protein, Zn/Mn family n=1 Tax=Vibrio sp. SCSIO 43136 TaxID=2819101 RepID=UPI002074DDAD|nr:zinc ABC transporter substrate-binding protein [Vibrio sp. SCSIO 43136]USD67273.1 zinc ABC transporter substrate-binding protein [Vibrio sp. SCSIO 43136]
MIFLTTPRVTLFLFVSYLSAYSPTVLAQLNIGITLHPYYSYVKNIVGDRAKVTPLIDAGFNPHAYKLSPADLDRLNSMDAIVINGIGHDQFAVDVLERLNLPNLSIIEANSQVPLISKAGSGTYNPHTFVSIDAAIRQVYTIAKALAKLDPENGRYFQKNALNYAKKLRAIKQQALKKITALNLENVRIASTHGAYAYLLQELGMTVTAVVEPAHGVSPNASQLQDTITKIRNANVQVLFTELNMANQYVEVIEKESNTRLFHFSHMTYGEYREELVEQDMSQNLNTLVTALSYAARRP